MKFKSSKTYAILRILLPCILFLAAKEIEKQLLTSYTQWKQTDRWLTEDRLMLLAECIILTAILIIRTNQGLNYGSFSFRRAARFLPAGAVLGIMAAFVNRILGISAASTLSVPGALVICGVGAASEEFVYRGFVLEGCRRVWSTPTSVAVSSLLFAAAHGNIYQTAEAFLVGLVFGIIVSRSNDVRNSCLAHAVTNTVIYLASAAL